MTIHWNNREYARLEEAALVFARLAVQSFGGPDALQGENTAEAGIRIESSLFDRSIMAGPERDAAWLKHPTEPTPYNSQALAPGDWRPLCATAIAEYLHDWRTAEPYKPLAVKSTRYSTEYVHKISNARGRTLGPHVQLSPSDLHSTGALASALRKAKVLVQRGRIREMRREAGGRIVVFPTVPEMTTYWHSIILTPQD